MKKSLMCLIMSVLSAPAIFAQDRDYVRPPSVGISFFLNDYATAQRIRSTSLTAVVRDKQIAKFREMSPGIALSYYQGLRNNIDFAGTLAGSFTDVPLPNQFSGSSDKFLLEADASVHFKLLSDKYFFTPFINLGIGASRYNKKSGAFIPLGLGLKFNFFNEAALLLNSQYRVALTQESAAYHFFNSIGIAGVVGKRKEQPVKTVDLPQQ
ncbi:MAG: hypothetical protein ABR502_00780 [Chitinophagaceae bacterium]